MRGYTRRIRFNSNLVRLKADNFLLRSKLLPGFNSNLVRLKAADIPTTTTNNVKSFNSNLVRLKVFCLKVSTRLRLCFNSNLVRLKEIAWRNSGRGAGKFQFQSGAIKSKTGYSRKSRFRCFNSNLVRLKVFSVVWKWSRLPSFNSNLVRLKDEIQKLLEKFQGRFQFQSGAIKRSDKERSVDLLLSFQFQSGAIKSGG